MQGNLGNPYFKLKRLENKQNDNLLNANDQKTKR